MDGTIGSRLLHLIQCIPRGERLCSSIPSSTELLLLYFCPFLLLGFTRMSCGCTMLHVVWPGAFANKIQGLEIFVGMLSRKVSMVHLCPSCRKQSHPRSKKQSPLGASSPALGWGWGFSHPGNPELSKCTWKGLEEQELSQGLALGFTAPGALPP